MYMLSMALTERFKLYKGVLGVVSAEQHAPMHCNCCFCEEEI